MAGKKESEGLQGPQNARWCSLFAHRKVPGRLDPFILYRDGTAQCSKEPGERIKQKVSPIYVQTLRFGASRQFPGYFGAASGA